MNSLLKAVDSFRHARLCEHTGKPEDFAGRAMPQAQPSRDEPSEDYATSKMRVPKFVIAFWKPGGTYSVAIQRSLPLGSSVAQE